jgi:hypothetical protein
MSAWLLPWLSAFVFTQAVETPLYGWWLHRRGVRGPKLAYAFVPSLVTHPVVWFVMPRLFSDWYEMVVVAETFAVVVEAALLWPWARRYAPLWALAANAASLTIGLTSRAVFGWP